MRLLLHVVSCEVVNMYSSLGLHSQVKISLLVVLLHVAFH